MGPLACVWGVRGWGLSKPNCPSLGRAAGARYPLAIGAGAVGVETRHEPHSARSCELALSAVGAARGCPGWVPACGASGVGRSPTPDRPSFGGAAGDGYPLAVGTLCARGGPAVPGTFSRAAVSRVLCALSAFATLSGRCCLAPVRVQWLWPATCFSGVPRGPPLVRLCLSRPLPRQRRWAAPRRTQSGPRDWFVPGRSLWLRSWAACAAVVWCVWTRSLTRQVSRTIPLSTGGSAIAPGLFRVDADTSPFGSEDTTPGSCVPVCAPLAPVGRAGLPGAFWCASPFLLLFCPPSLLGPLRAGVARASGVCFFFVVCLLPPLSSPVPCRAPAVSSFSCFPALGALGLGALCLLLPAHPPPPPAPPSPPFFLFFLFGFFCCPAFPASRPPGSRPLWRPPVPFHGLPLFPPPPPPRPRAFFWFVFLPASCPPSCFSVPFFFSPPAPSRRSFVLLLSVPRALALTPAPYSPFPFFFPSSSSLRLPCLVFSIFSGPGCPGPRRFISAGPIPLPCAALRVVCALCAAAVTPLPAAAARVLLCLVSCCVVLRCVVGCFVWFVAFCSLFWCRVVLVSC